MGIFLVVTVGRRALPGSADLQMISMSMDDTMLRLHLLAEIGWWTSNLSKPAGWDPKRELAIGCM